MRLVAGKHEEFAGIDGVFLLAHHQRQAAFEHEHLHAPAFRVWLRAVAVPRLQAHFPQLDFAPRGGKKTPLKANADQALLHCSDKVKCLVVKHVGDQTHWTQGRDFDLKAEMAAAKPYWLGQSVAIVGSEGLAQSYARALRAQGADPRLVSGTDATLAGLAAARARVTA